MNIVDSSGWLEFFTDGPNAQKYQLPLKDVETLVVPVISIYEVFKVVLRERNEDAAIQAAMVMQKGKVIEITPSIAIAAARISLKLSLPMADSLILATAELYNATIWTQDADFKDIPGVKYLAKK